MADEQSKVVPNETANLLKRKRDSEQETVSSSSQKDNEGLQSPPAKIAARNVDVKLSSPPVAVRRVSVEENAKNLPTSSSASASLEASQRKSTEVQGDEDKGGVEKMQ